MKETAFIQQNKDKWRKFEELNKSQNSNPDEVSELFVEITEDLSYAQTFYPRRSVRVYLNGIAQQVFTQLYKFRKNPLKKFVEFWMKGLPLEMYRSRKNLLISFLIFSISCLIGVISTENDINFAKVVLSDSYVEMTNSFIESGDPMAVYKDSPSYEMFLQIFFNNIQVAFYCFIFGIFFSVGTGLFLVTNGIMLGSFQSYFYYKGLTKSAVFGKQLLFTTFLSIWIHGAFEISAIIIAGAAGLTLGNGLMFPGTYSRLQSLQITAKRGIKIMVGLIPFFFIAAVFESWVTRHTEWPVWLKLMIILSSFIIVILYFVIYPFIVAKNYPEEVETNEEPLFHTPVKIEKYKIRPVNELFSDSFSFYRMCIKYINPVIWRILIPLNLGLMIYIISQNTYYFGYNLNPAQMTGGMYALSQTFTIPTFLATVFLFWLNAVTLFHSVQYAYSSKEKTFWRSWISYVVLKGYRFIFPVAFFFGLFIPGYFILFFIGFMLFPVIQQTFCNVAEGNKNFIEDFFSGITKGFQTWGNGFLLLLLFMVITFCFFLMFSGLALILNLFFDAIEWHFMSLTDHFYAIKNGILGFCYMIFFQYLFPIYYLAFNLLYYSNEEKEKAIGLRARLARFGKINKTYESDFEHED